MHPELKKLIQSKQHGSEPLSFEEKKKGFKGWYASKSLPHFDSAGTQQFISYHLADSMPAERRSEWKAFIHLENDQEKHRKLQAYLDRGLGMCPLRNPRITEMVQDNLWHRDGINYRLHAWVIMPNHIHVLLEVWQIPMGKILRCWKSYTAKASNHLLGQKGTFWAADYFDRYIRDEDHYARVVHYIENNPVKAGLVKTPEEWAWSSAPFEANKAVHRVF